MALLKTAMLFFGKPGYLCLSVQSLFYCSETLLLPCPVPDTLFLKDFGESDHMPLNDFRLKNKLACYGIKSNQKLFLRA